MTAQTKHTPGPWGRNIKPASKYSVIYAGRNTHVAQVCVSGLSAEEIEGNCDLIVAAPEMLSLLKRINEAFYVSGKRKDMIEVMAETKGLIHKADGRTEQP